jgi:hypothetical protein
MVEDQVTKQERLLSIGVDDKNFNHLGISQSEADDKTKFYREISYFSGFKIKDFTAGNRSSYVVVEGDKDYCDNLYEHSIPEVDSKAKGFLHFYKDTNGKFVYLSEAEYEN